MKKKLILGIMVLVLVAILAAQNSFATSLLSTGGTENNTIQNTGTVSLNGNDGTSSDVNSLVGPTTTTTPSTTTPENSTLNTTPLTQNNTVGNNSTLGGSTYNNSLTNNNTKSNLPKTGLDNTFLFVLTAIAIVSVIIAFKKISDYGNI